jgi:glutathione S-transferase
MIKLHALPGAASLAPHILLNEIGVPFELKFVDRDAGEHKSPALGTAQRAHVYKWLVWLTNTMQAHLIHYFYPERMVDDGHAAGVAQVKAHAQARVQGCLVQIDEQLARHGGAWLLGAQYSAADAYAFMLCRWTRNFSDGPARGHPHIAPHLQRMLARPAVQCAFATEGLQPPLV